MEHENEYFDRLEKKENIELKKEKVTQLTVSAVQCKKVSLGNERYRHAGGRSFPSIYRDL